MKAGTAMHTLVITVGLPDRALSPNVHRHRMARDGSRAAAAVAKHEAWARTVEAIRCGRVPKGLYPARRAAVEMVFFWPDTRRRDEDNAISSTKPHRDGMVDGGALVDDRKAIAGGLGITSLSCRFEVDKLRPRLEIHVTPEP